VVGLAGMGVGDRLQPNPVNSQKLRITKIGVRFFIGRSFPKQALILDCITSAGQFSQRTW
jgi:hypothetical protein